VKHAASSLPAGVHGTVRARFAGSTARLPTSSANAASESTSARDARWSV
jgi:hypothetical protein